MADLVPILREVRGIYSDRARDRLPEGSVWESTDWVPLLLQAGVRMRGAWKYQSPALPSAPEGMFYAPFRAESKLLVCAGGTLYNIPLTAPGLETVPGAVPVTRQNPVFHRNRMIVPAADGVSVAKIVVWSGTAWSVTDMPATAPKGRYATVWKDRVVLGNTSVQPTQLAFSKPGDPTVPWDALSSNDTSYEITGLASQRTQILIFHASSVERLRGTIVPDSQALPADQEGDLILDFLFARAGCYDARSIGYWQENVIFADARGIHVTDGAVVRNIVVQAGVANLWYAAFDRGGPPQTIAGAVYQDYYIATVRHGGYPPITFVVDIPNRRVFQLANVDAGAYAYSIGVGEQLFGTDQQTLRITDCTPFFSPDATVLQVDGDGTPVLPVIGTGFSLLSNRVGNKRVIDMHLNYEAHRDDDVDVLRASYVDSPSGQNQAIGEFKPSVRYTRRKIPIRRRLPGFATHIEQLVPTRDSRLYDISVRTYPEEQHRL